LIQGVGRVGQPLARLVAASGGRLFVSDISDKSIEALRAWVPEFERVPAESALRTGCDVLAPCADADVLDEATIPELHCKVVCGSANHPLRNPDEEAAMLADRDILYAVDWVANVGGVITADEAYHALRARRRLDGHRVLAHTLAAVTEGLGRVFARARETGSDPYKAAVDLFEPVIYGE
jgi:leucine dehydrogenase